ncbi:BT4734/BF3469 family protein [uncultured Parabacteroides sp.]|uniref:BT4734/BF3469 family protein n=1 Tax=uncultured Parabacteroides sp. TaxID=512312 RepID=UPI00258A9D90|nr:BT4734/BF3469 family protein [uncultured Parabacteroides sp.]
MKVTKQNTYRKKPAQRALGLDELVMLLKEEKIRETVEHFRERLQRAYPNKSYAYTRKLPQILFAGTFRCGEMKEYNGWVLLEINHLSGKDEASVLRKKVAGYPQTLFAMVGSSGRSVKFVVPYTRPDGSLPRLHSEAELFHAHAYRHALKTYEPRLSYPIELKHPVLEQCCRLSYDPEVYYNPEALVIHLEQPSEMPAESLYQEKFEKRMPAQHLVKSYYDHHRYLSVQYELALGQAIEKYGDLDENFDFKPVLVCLGQLCFGAGIGEEECVKWTLLYFGNIIPEVEIRETIGHTYLKENGFGNQVLCKPEQLQALKTEEFMNRRYDFRFNTMAGGTEYRERNSFCFDYRPMTERVMNSIALNAQKEGLQLWDRDVRRYVNSDRIPDYAPIEDYLARLPEWDGKDRIRPLAARISCNNLRWEQLFYTWFLSMVAHWQGRDRQHGNSVSPLLVGEQGCGKSTFCFNLLPPQLNKYYTDSIDFSRKRDAELYLTRFGLINIDEFDQVTSKHQGFLKHLLQKPVVNLRKPYASQVEAIRRYASFIATSNHTDLLSDPSGSRRFICIEVKGIIDNTQPIAHEQLYSQAIAALNKGERYWFTHEEELVQMQENEEFQQRPLCEDLFYRFYRPAENREEGVKMSAGEIYLSVQEKSRQKLPGGQISHFGRFLKKSGLTSYNTNRGRLYLVVERQI